MLSGPFSLKQNQKSIYGLFSFLPSRLPLRDRRLQASPMNNRIKKACMMQPIFTGKICQ